MKQALEELKTILTGVDFWLSGGQILGPVREGKFLNNEHDIDLGIHQKDLDKVIKILNEKIGKCVVSDKVVDNNVVLRPIDYTNIIRCIKFKLKDISIDILVYIPIRDKLYAVTHDNKWGHAFHGFPKELFKTLKPIKIYDIEYPIPSDPIKYLELEYGDWKTVIKEWNCCIDPPCIAKKVYLGGIFDLFHIGHLRLLKRARDYGEILYVSVLTDEAAERYKRKPIIPYEQRVEIIKEFADIVIPQFDVDESKNNYIDDIYPDVIVHGDDSLPHSYTWAILNKKETIQIPYTKEISTTGIIDRIKNE
jgi:choline-phosphate cytidylyltransferase/glycerol-3-phosphate cytidylyltransferase